MLTLFAVVSLASPFKHENIYCPRRLKLERLATLPSPTSALKSCPCKLWTEERWEQKTTSPSMHGTFRTGARGPPGQLASQPAEAPRLARPARARGCSPGRTGGRQGRPRAWHREGCDWRSRRRCSREAGRGPGGSPGSAVPPPPPPPSPRRLGAGAM